MFKKLFSKENIFLHRKKYKSNSITKRILLLSTLILPFTLIGGELPIDPVFDFNFIFNEPLKPKILKKTEKESIVIEEVEFTSDYDCTGKPIRTFGILAYPKAGKNLPAIVWAQGGMANAGLAFPAIFAHKGYMSISINLPKKEWGAFNKFNAKNPKNSNFVRIAVTHMRAITYLANRPEVDKDRIAIGGSSYGGMFANIVAGADPRVKAGMAFFGGGNHHLGTNLPQFTALQSLKDIEIFKNTADGGFRFRNKSVPFLWGIASNDHWFYMPAVVQTYIEAGGTKKRMGIKPLWDHGFPPEFDQQLVDWFDIHLMKTRLPYNQPSLITVKNEKDKLVAYWNWQGKNKIQKAELIVSYGKIIPWHGWIHRYHHRINALINDKNASAEIPLYEPSMPIYIYANIIDSNGVLTSSMPLTVIPEKYGCRKKTSLQAINTAPWGNFEPEDIDFLKRHCELPFGSADRKNKFSGTQSLSVKSSELTPKKHTLKFKLFNIYERSHNLSLMIKSNKPANLKIEVKSVTPANWNKPAVKVLLKTKSKSTSFTSDIEIPTYSLEAKTNNKWQKYTLKCPYNGMPIEGYNLSIDFPVDKNLLFWLDKIEFIPTWKIKNIKN